VPGIARYGWPAANLEAVLKLLLQNQSLVDVGARLRAIGRIIVGKRASTINELVFVQTLRRFPEIK
jgi:hypothetical protein